MSILQVRELAKRFGGLIALSDLSLTVAQGEIVGVIGPNGAGKTTLFNAITGFHRPTHGEVTFEERTITGFKPNRIAALGLVRTWQLVNLAKSKTVFENLRVACHLQHAVGVWGSIFRSQAARHEEAKIGEYAEGLLATMGLADVRDEAASALPYGLQRLLGICLALASRPRMLLLDEPAAGMSAQETGMLMERIRAIRGEGITLMLVEHDMKVIMNVCDRIIVLNFGSKLAEGTPKEISTDQEVIRAYLGFENGNQADAA